MKTMNLALSLVTLLSASSGFAQSDSPAQQKFLNAITVCPTQNNPLGALTELNGNSFGNVNLDSVDGSIVKADVISNPKLQNLRVGAPARIKGSIEVKMDYPAPTFALVCTLSIKSL